MANTVNSLEQWSQCLQSPGYQTYDQVSLDDILSDLNIFSVDQQYSTPAPNCDSNSNNRPSSINTETTSPVISNTASASASKLPEALAFGSDFVKTLHSFCTYLYGRESDATEHSRTMAEMRILKEELLLVKAKNIELIVENERLRADYHKLKAEKDFIFMPNPSGLEFLTYTKTAFKLYKSATTLSENCPDSLEPNTSTHQKTVTKPEPDIANSVGITFDPEKASTSRGTKDTNSGDILKRKPSQDQTPVIGKQPRRWGKSGKYWNAMMNRQKNEIDTSKKIKSVTEKGQTLKKTKAQSKAKKPRKPRVIETTTDDDY